MLKLNNSHKALAISLLISGSVSISLFNYSLNKQNKITTETLVDITSVNLFDETI